MVDRFHSVLEKNKEKLEEYIKAIEEAIGHNTKVVGILEIGSFANSEGMEFSDIDTRVYVESENVYLWNVDGHASSEEIFNEHKDLLEKFILKYGKKPIVNFTWTEFNVPLWERLWDTLGIQIEFGLVDKRYAEFELDNLDLSPSNEHSFLLQSNIIYDPRGFLAGRKKKMEGKIFPTMVEFYSKRFLGELPSEIYQSIEMSEADLADIRNRNKIQWIKRAVRCVREAVTTKLYISNGQIIHKKNDILSFYKKYVPEKYDFVAMLYDWKINPDTRKIMIQECLKDPHLFSQKFQKLMPELEATIKAVRNVEV